MATKPKRKPAKRISWESRYEGARDAVQELQQECASLRRHNEVLARSCHEAEVELMRERERSKKAESLLAHWYEKAVRLMPASDFKMLTTPPPPVFDCEKLSSGQWANMLCDQSWFESEICGYPIPGGGYCILGKSYPHIEHLCRNSRGKLVASLLPENSGQPTLLARLKAWWTALRSPKTETTP